MTVSACEQTTLAYRVNDVPNLWLALLLGFQVTIVTRLWQNKNYSIFLLLQQVMSAASSILVAPFQVSQLVCAGSATAVIRVQLISATFVVCGLATILQCLLGLRYFFEVLPFAVLASRLRSTLKRQSLSVGGTMCSVQW
jgi:hypothetical protein